MATSFRTHPRLTRSRDPLTERNVRCKCYLHSHCEVCHAYRSKARRTRKTSLDRADDPRLHGLVAARPRDPRLHHRERTNGLLAYHNGMDRWQRQNGPHAGEDGPHARQMDRGAPRLVAAPAPSSGNRAFDDYRTETLRGSKTSSASSRISWSGCASPRTVPNSTSSWPNAVTGRPINAPPQPQTRPRLSRPQRDRGHRGPSISRRWAAFLWATRPARSGGTRPAADINAPLSTAGLR